MTAGDLRRILSHMDDNMEVCTEDIYRGKKLLLPVHAVELTTANRLPHNPKAFRANNDGNEKVIVIR
jgi:hypothetical protein